MIWVITSGALETSEIDLRVFFRTNVCNDMGDYIWSFQCFKVIHFDDVLFPAPSCPFLDKLKWCVPGDWYPQKTSLFADGSRCQPSLPVTQWPSISNHHDESMDICAAQGHLSLGSHQRQ